MNFHKDELIWRDDNHQHDQAMTWLTSIESDDEFDRMVMLIRFARAFSGEKKSSLNHWKVRSLRILADKVVVVGFFAFFRFLDLLVRVCDKIFRVLKHRITGRPNRPPHDQYSFYKI